MSQENLDVAIAGLTAATTLPKPDYETVNRLYSPDHVLVPLPISVGHQFEGRGAEGFKDWREDIQDVLQPEHTLRGAVDVGADKVLAVFITRFTGPTSQVTAEQRTWVAMTVAGGKITRTELYGDPAEALEAVGLTE
jgi:ketosteroid isomerase-like protein